MTTSDGLQEWIILIIHSKKQIVIHSGMKELTCFMNESLNHLLDLLDLGVVLLLFSKKYYSWNKYQSSMKMY